MRELCLLVHATCDSSLRMGSLKRDERPTCFSQASDWLPNRIVRLMSFCKLVKTKMAFLHIGIFHRSFTVILELIGWWRVVPDMCASGSSFTSSISPHPFSISRFISSPHPPSGNFHKFFVHLWRDLSAVTSRKDILQNSDSESDHGIQWRNGPNSKIARRSLASSLASGGSGAGRDSSRPHTPTLSPVLNRSASGSRLAFSFQSQSKTTASYWKRPVTPDSCHFRFSAA